MMTYQQLSIHLWKKNIFKNIIIKLSNHDTWFTPPFCSLFQSKNFVKFSYHALETCFNLGLSLVFLSISISVAEVVVTKCSVSLSGFVFVVTEGATTVFCNWFSAFSVRQTTSFSLKTILRNSLSFVTCLEQPLAKWKKSVKTAFKEVEARQ